VFSCCVFFNVCTAERDRCRKGCFDCNGNPAEKYGLYCGCALCSFAIIISEVRRKVFEAGVAVPKDVLDLTVNGPLSSEGIVIVSTLGNSLVHSENTTPHGLKSE
jgi:hypothetical protein